MADAKKQLQKGPIKSGTQESFQDIKSGYKMPMMMMMMMVMVMVMMVIVMATVEMVAVMIMVMVIMVMIIVVMMTMMAWWWWSWSWWCCCADGRQVTIGRPASFDCRNPLRSACHSKSHCQCQHRSQDRTRSFHLCKKLPQNSVKTCQDLPLQFKHLLQSILCHLHL